MMPVMNGWEFLQAQKTNSVFATIPVVVVSAVAEKARDLDSSSFVKKPVDLDSLLRLVKEYCE
jgi:CheY-like chemotaxis protein